MTQPDRQGQLDPGGSPGRPPRRGWKIFVRFCTGLFTGIDLPSPWAAGRERIDMRRLAWKLRGSLGERRCWLGGWGRGDGEMLRRDQRWDESRYQNQWDLASAGCLVGGKEEQIRRLGKEQVMLGWG